MNLKQDDFSLVRVAAKKSAPINIKGIIGKYVYHWPLYVIVLIPVFLLAFYYLKIAKPVYEVKASLTIQDEKKTPDTQSPLHDLQLESSAKIIENEIEVLKSKRLIDMVVQNLQLWITYKKKGEVSSFDLYKSGPVKLTFIKTTENIDQARLSIVIIDTASFYVNMPSGKRQKFLYNNIYHNSWGIWRLTPTAELSNFKGATIEISLSDPDQVALQYQKAIDVSLTNKLSTALDLTITDQVAQRGKDFLNYLITFYSSSASTEKSDEVKRNLDFINSKIDSLTNGLDKTEKGLEGYESSQGVADITADTKASVENMQTYQNKLNDINVQLDVVNGIESYINSSQNSGKIPSTSSIADPLLNSSVEKLIQLQTKREQLLAVEPETNPDFDPINKQIVLLRSTIKENIRTTKTSLEDAKKRLSSLTSQYRSDIKTIPTEKRQLNSIKRQQDSKESVLTYMLQKREQLLTQYASIIPNQHIIDHAYAGQPKKAQALMILAIAFLAGLAMPTGLLYARNSLSTKITSIDQIKDTVEIPIIAEVPFEASKSQIAITDHSITPTTEQFRALRTKLYHLYGEEKIKGRITLITSSVSGEGKSFISSNLAVAMAYANRKTIILELDMRKPKIAQIFDLHNNNHPGINDYISGNATPEVIIQSSGLVKNLDVITSNILAGNPAELLEQSQLQDLINFLKDIYDDIIIDTPPVHLVPDALILSKLADLTLYIVRQGYTQIAELNFLKELNDQNQLSNINLIFNGIERVKYGYGYNYVNTYYNAKKGNAFKAAFSNFSKRF